MTPPGEAPEQQGSSTIPDSELWLHQPEAAARLDRALLAIDQPPAETDLEALERHLSELS